MLRPLSPASRRIGKILERLTQAYPDAACSLNFSNPLELLIATILSAQCTDVLVNKVTAELFKKYRTAADYATTPLPTLARDISRVNFYRNKAKNIQGACRLLVERFGGKVPNRMEDLLELPGVARKTANVVLGNAFHVEAGIVVDTHVMRLSQRLGLTVQAVACGDRHSRRRPHLSVGCPPRSQDRDKIEQDLLRLVPQPRWTRFGHQMITHGRRCCTAKAPTCGACPLGKPLCPSYQAPSAA